MKKTCLFLLSALCLCLSACSNDDDGGYPPTFQGFRYEPATVYPGDSVTITAVQLKKGNNIYGAKHAWTLTLKVDNNGTEEELTLSYNTPSGRNESSTENPSWGVKIPANTVGGTAYPCRFTANWNNAADGESVSFNGGTGEGCVGTINSENSVLYSRANGSFNLPIRKRQ